MSLPFAAPVAVRQLLDDLESGGFDPRCVLAADGAIVVSVSGERVSAEAVFRRRSKGYVLVGGSLLVDGLLCPTVTSIGQLRQVFDDPDGHLTTRKNHEPPPHVRRLMALSGKKDELRSIRAV